MVCRYSSTISPVTRLILTVLVLLLAAGTAAGAASLNAEPPKEATFRTGLKKELSCLNVGFEASDRELTAQLNRLVPQELYRGAALSGGIGVVVVRNGALTVTAADNYLYLTLPITMTLRYGPFQTPAITTSLRFRVGASVSPDWSIRTDIQYLGLSDLMAETVGIGPLTLKPRSIIDGMMSPVQGVLSGLVGRRLNEQFPLKAQVARAWSAAQKPILLNREYSAWLRIAPQGVQFYPLSAQNHRLQLNVGLTAFPELVIGPEPPPLPVVPLPALQLARTPDRTFRVALATNLFYRDLRAIVATLLLNKEVGGDGRSVILKEFDIYGNGDQLAIKVETAGDLEGTFYLTARPVFDPRTNRFSVEDVEFDLQSKSMLLSAADWFLHGTIRSRIQEKLNLDLTQRMTQARALISNAMARTSLTDNLALTGTVNTLALNDVMVQRDSVAIQVLVEGTATMLFR